jgi:anti-anti-sigma regulatory factor
MENFWTWTQNGMPVVTTPDGVDVANDSVLQSKLLAAAARSPVVIVDTDTCNTFLSVSAMRILDQVGRRMADAGGELRIVITKPKTRRNLEIVRYDRHLRFFESLPEALSASQQERKPRPLAA